MEYLHVTSFDDFRAQEIYKSYTETFPPDERRNENQFRQLFSKQKVKVLTVLHELENIGYLICWQMTDFIFLEHFEIFSEFRSKKYGQTIISDLFKDYTHIVLETEPAAFSPEAKRRISFYEKTGFGVIDEHYVQPCYEDGKNSLDLWLMANWKPEKTDWIKEEIYDVAYC
ncbi:GNAT family N-acetyltransferase [Chryseobacterium sp. MP_3.2]|uniref:GNAT family N-acetyltransferase n=1 Tax=Chryseobacterium sp. MP_3.2 TaxID=3071712 RepID=UPI002DFAF88C|nr:ribosomal protein S18 acetylase RimI-like enzyme [Chryseobacterium sp. MP_3.2]